MQVLNRLRGVSLAAALACGMAAAGCSRAQAGAAPAAAVPPPPMQVATAVERDVPIEGNWIATLQGYVNAQIQPHVSGYLIRQNYREGAPVAKDAVLFEIDPRPFQAVLDQAQAQLQQAQAKLDDARLNVERDVPEAAAHAIPQSQLQTDTQAQLGAQAGVAADQAALEQAELNLDYCQVRSLVGGIAGIAQVQVGNLVSPTTVLTTVSQVDPIKAYFPISGAEYLAMAAHLNTGSDPLRLDLTLSNGSAYPYAGHVLFADRQLDPQTGTMEVVGAFPNPHNLLRPGQTGQIRAETTVLRHALLIPQRSVTEMQDEYEVAVVGADNRVSIRVVKVGPQTGSLWVIEQGLQPGERVIAEGAAAVRNGQHVTPVPYTPAPNPPAPAS